MPVFLNCPAEAENDADYGRGRNKDDRMKPFCLFEPGCKEIQDNHQDNVGQIDEVDQVMAFSIEILLQNHECHNGKSCCCDQPG